MKGYSGVHFTSNDSECVFQRNVSLRLFVANDQRVVGSNQSLVLLEGRGLFGLFSKDFYVFL